MSNGSANVQIVLLPGDTPFDRLMALSREEAFSDLRVAVAFATEQGVNIMTSVMAEHPSWEDSAKRFLIGIDYGTTQPQALRRLCSLSHSDVRVPGFEEVLADPALQRKSVFHPKAYCLGRNANEFNLFIGSPNLTRNGLKANVEAGIIVVGNQLPRTAGHQLWGDFSGWWNRLCSSSKALTEDDIGRYEEHRLRLRASIPDQFVMEEPSPSELAGAGFLWIEAGFLSGGSQNQLELPNGVEAFFNIPEPSPDAHEDLILEMGENTWSAPIRYWRNQVWRLRLPTERDGLGNYANQVICFRRHEAEGRFGIEIADVDSDEHHLWLGRSRDMGAVRRTRPGEGGRDYGWF